MSRAGAQKITLRGLAYDQTPPMVLTQISQHELPLTPHHYPGWAKAFIAFIISMTIYALFSMPAYFKLKESVAMAKAAYKNADYDAAITGYSTIVQIRPHSKVARIGAAEALFARGHEEDATEGLFWLQGLTLSKKEYARIEKVMPKDYQQYFESKKH